ncbi:hypothetical protein CVD28_02485 [Bacillus sp. M6-12]|uniref:hypothetical protein n=1 Tax=Bacillus sp. M6-12 TaxID=2054166 RepID=UPI000C757E83|nr:hypothetical protein [Bacillus sp. M6-12]PLS19300.1 hypothetical protein CVD28_02485 [Bacillus sp. M6-12]
MYINLSKDKKISYDEFIQQAVELTTAKGVFDSVEENIRDYFKPYQPEDIYLVNGSTHEENMGKIFIGNTLYKDLSSLRVSVVGHFNGTNDFFKRRKRNQLGANAVIKILNHFL